MTRKIIGIDPGKKGGIAVLDMADRRVDAIAMPDTPRGLHEALTASTPVSLAVLEKPFYPRQIGTTNAAKIAENYGILKGALLWLDIPTFEVRPKDWKRSLSVSTDKNEARRRAGEFFPLDADQWKLKKHDGLAEAALIAWFGVKWL